MDKDVHSARNEDGRRQCRHVHYYEKHLLGRVKTHFFGRLACPLLVLAAKNVYLYERVAKLPLKIGFLGWATPQPPLKMNFQGRLGGGPPQET